MKKQNKSNLGETDMLPRNKNSCTLVPWEADAQMESKCARCLLWSTLGGDESKGGQREIKLQERAHDRLSLGLRGHNSLSEFPKLGQDAQASIPHMERSLDMNHPRKRSNPTWGGSLQLRQSSECQQLKTLCSQHSRSGGHGPSLKGPLGPVPHCPTQRHQRNHNKYL